jgi:hypothetical protein
MHKEMFGRQQRSMTMTEEKQAEEGRRHEFSQRLMPALARIYDGPATTVFLRPEQA